jgi:hypothetical protein
MQSKIRNGRYVMLFLVTMATVSVRAEGETQAPSNILEETVL